MNFKRLDALSHMSATKHTSSWSRVRVVENSNASGPTKLSQGECATSHAVATRITPFRQWRRPTARTLLGLHMQLLATQVLATWHNSYLQRESWLFSSSILPRDTVRESSPYLIKRVLWTFRVRFSFCNFRSLCSLVVALLAIIFSFVYWCISYWMWQILRRTISFCLNWKYRAIVQLRYLILCKAVQGVANHFTSVVCVRVLRLYLH